MLKMAFNNSVHLWFMFIHYKMRYIDGCEYWKCKHSGECSVYNLGKFWCTSITEFYGKGCEFVSTEELAE